MSFSGTAVCTSHLPPRGGATPVAAVGCLDAELTLATADVAWGVGGIGSKAPPLPFPECPFWGQEGTWEDPRNSPRAIGAGDREVPRWPRRIMTPKPSCWDLARGQLFLRGSLHHLLLGLESLRTGSSQWSLTRWTELAVCH